MNISIYDGDVSIEGSGQGNFKVALYQGHGFNYVRLVIVDDSGKILHYLATIEPDGLIIHNDNKFPMPIGSVATCDSNSRCRVHVRTPSGEMKDGSEA